MFELINKLRQALNNACLGLKATFHSQWAFRFEMLAFVISIPITFVIGITVVQRILLVSSFLLVLIVELINTAIETVINRISTEPHELSGRAKDMGSAAVLIAVINLIVVWLLIAICNFL